MNIVELPDTVLFSIFEYLSYDEIARKREVCKRFNHMGQIMLNAGFNRIVCEHGKNFKRIKALLPRRESERRNHNLSRHADILTSIETRISMLSMTYSKYIDLNLCCFIPGRVLDEIKRILRLVATSTKPLRPHEVLQELRDISSMAIEHFDERIAVDFKMEHMAKLAVQRSVHPSLAELSFSGEIPSAQRWSAMVSLASRSVNHQASVSSQLATANSNNARSCDSMIQRLNRLLAMGMTSPNRTSQSTTTTQTNDVSIEILGTPPPLPAELLPFPQVACYSPAVTDPESPDIITILDHEDITKQLKDARLFKVHCAKKIRRLRMTQRQQTHGLREAHNAIAELSAQVSELKKQLEDVVANNLKLPTNIELPPPPPQPTPQPPTTTTATSTASPVAAPPMAAAQKRHSEERQDDMVTPNKLSKV